MSLVVDLPPGFVRSLTEEAAKRGQSPAALARTVLESWVRSADTAGLRDAVMPVPDVKTGADPPARWRAAGFVGEWADRDDLGDSADYARRLRRRVQRRRTS